MKEKSRTLACAFVALLLISMLAALPPPTVLAQYSREETVIVSSAFGPPTSWNPLFPATTCYFMNAMYPTVYMYSWQTDEWIPYLAKGYRWKDKITLLVTIRDEAKWWDGIPITSYDVKYSIELGKKYNVGMYTPLWTYIEKITTPDPKLVQIYVNAATLNYFQILTLLWQCLILPKHIWQPLETTYGDTLPTDFKNDDPATIVGGGPYKLKEWSTEAYFYERVDDWWGKTIFGVPTVKYICHRDFMDCVSSRLAFEAGDIDVETHMVLEIWKLWEVEGLPVRTYYAHPPYYKSTGIVPLCVNFLKKGLNNTDVRRAIAHTINKTALARLYYNYGDPAIAVPIIHTNPVAAQYIDWALIDQYGWTYDIAKANEILDAAGIVDTDGDGFRDLPDGFDLKGFTIQVPYGWMDWMWMCDMIVAELAKIGIGCTAVYPEFTVWYNRLLNKELDINIQYGTDPQAFDHPWNAFRALMDPRLSAPAGNWQNYVNPAVPALIDAIPKETDPAKKKSMYNQLQEIFLKDVVSIPMFYGAQCYEYSYKYWVGWPNEENGNWFAGFFGGTPSINGWPNQLPTLFTLVPQPDPTNPTWFDVPQPAWVGGLKFSTSQIFADLAAAPLRSADLNGDLKINIMDIAIAAKAYGSYLGHPRWDFRADINLDNKVDIKDIYYVAKRFGKIEPRPDC